MEYVYPSGDEYEVVYHATGKRIPAGGFPAQIGIIVQNVETLYNINRAAQGLPVTHSMVSIHGHIKNPQTAWFPIGTSYGDVIKFAGGVTIRDFVIVDGGAMMGTVTEDLEQTVSRTTAGFIIVPKDSHLTVRKTQPERAYRRVGKSVCDQCSLCTEMCPRYLLGYPIKPHLVMRSLLTTGEMSETLTHWAQACCECNICSLWACPEELDPRNICATTKRDLKINNRWLSQEQLEELQTEVHPLREYRHVPSKKLARRLGLDVFSGRAEFLNKPFFPEKVKISLKQSFGQNLKVVVKKGESLSEGQLIAEPQEIKMSVPVHASIGGRITEIDQNFITIEK